MRILDNIRRRAATSVARWVSSHASMQPGGRVSAKLQMPELARPMEACINLFAAVRKRAALISSFPLLVSDDQDNLVESGPLYDLLQKPNSRQDQAGYNALIEVYRALYGDFDLWVRPIKMFLEEVEVDDEKIPRFRFID